MTTNDKIKTLITNALCSTNDENFDFKIHKTLDYSIFKNVVGNRSIKASNFHSLIQSFKEKQLIIPIICSEDKVGNLVVIDGQHRLAVCKELELPVYYVNVPNYGLKDIEIANRVMATWKVDDFIHMYSQVGNENYIKLNKLASTYSLSTTSVSHVLAHYQGKKNNKFAAELRRGELDLTNFLQADLFFQDLYNCFGSFAFHSNTFFVRAFFKLYNYQDYSHKVMVDKFNKYGYKLEKRASEKDYLNTLVNDIYICQNKIANFRYDRNSDKFYNV